MPKKPRKAPAKAPVLHSRVDPDVAESDLGEPAAGEDDEPLRFDLDQPPVTGVTGRPSVYSEWLNSSPRPGVASAWLNSPVPPAPAAPAAPLKLAVPRPAAAPVPPPAPAPASTPTPTPIPMRRARAVDQPGAPPRQDAPPAEAASRPASGTGRSRRATSARRLTVADRLSVDPETLKALSADSTLADGPLPRPSLEAETERVAEQPGAKAAAPSASSRRATAAPAPMPAAPPTAANLSAMDVLPSAPAASAALDTPTSASRRATGARLPATLGETTKRTAIPAGGSTARRPSPQRLAAQGESSGRVEVPRAVRVDLDADEWAAGRGPVEADVALAIQETAAHLPAMHEEAGPPAEASVLIRGTARPPRPTTGRVVPRRMRPPSIITQAVVALATVIVLMGALAISSPLGYGAAISGTFQAYANSVVWIPTPTPTATATPVPVTYQSVPASPGQQVIVNEITSIFGQYAQGALNISHCESGWVAAAYNPYPVGNSHAEGVFQILFPSTWDTTSYASRSPYDYDANIRAAWQIFSRDGYSWREWECKPY